MATRKQVIEEARTWVGTPFHHQGRIKGEFVDCAGIISGTANNTGLSTFDITNYGAFPVPALMEKIMDDNMDRVAQGEEKPGDVFWMKDPEVGGRPRHTGILTDQGTIIHADGKFGKCVEHQFDQRHRDAVVRWYRYRGLVD